MSTMFTCGVDLCTKGVHFCDSMSRICRLCSDYVRDCFSDSHHINCSAVCRDALKGQMLRDLREQDCSPLPELLNGQHNGTSGNSSYGDNVLFNCRSGYKLIGAENLTCGDFGRWLGFPPVCELTDDVTQAMDGTSKSSEYVLIGWITALAILVIVSNIPSAILVYKHLRRKRMTGQTPNESRNSSEAEMDNLQQNLQQNPQPAPPPGPLPRPTSPSVGDPDQTTRMAAEPASQPWGLPDPYNTSHDPADSDQTTRRSISRRPDSGGQSLANVARFDATYDRDQTNSLSLFGGGDRYQPQPCTSDGSTSATGSSCASSNTPVLIQETEKGAAEKHTSAMQPRTVPQVAMEQPVEDKLAGRQHAWERSESTGENEHHDRETVYSPLLAPACHGQDTEPPGRKVALGNRLGEIDRNDVARRSRRSSQN